MIERCEWDTARSSTATSVAAGTVFVLCTDGPVERRGKSLDAGLARLVDSVRLQAAETDVRNDARRLVARMTDRGRIDDDVAVVSWVIERSS